MSYEIASNEPMYLSKMVFMMRILFISILSIFIFLLNGHQKVTVKDTLYRFWHDILSTMKTNISHVNVTVKSAKNV